jgi:hypothetical protein
MGAGQYPVELLAGYPQAPGRLTDRQPEGRKHVFPQNLSRMNGGTFQRAFYGIFVHVLYCNTSCYSINIFCHGNPEDTETNKSLSDRIYRIDLMVFPVSG